MLHALITLAQAEAEEPSKTPFYVAGAVLVLFAAVVSFLGITRDNFPGSKGLARGVMGLAIVLVAATMATAVITG